MDMVRCPSCRGAKKMAKLGGVIGDCNTCNGDGKIKACDKPVSVVVVNEPVCDIVSQVAECLPVSNVDTKIDGKRAVYKRKKA